MKFNMYFSRIITPEKVLELYKLLNKELPGKAAGQGYGSREYEVVEVQR